MMHIDRVQKLNDAPIRTGDYVLYWMQASQRTKFNHALEFSINQANKQNKPLVVYFGLMESYPEANLRHYKFMIDGLNETNDSLEKRNIQLVLLKGEPHVEILDIAGSASQIIVDRGYLRHHADWRSSVAKNCECRITQVETDVVVPIETASPKEEYTAGTFRPKIHRVMEPFLESVEYVNLEKSSLTIPFDSLSNEDLDNFLSSSRIDSSVKPVKEFLGGSSQAEIYLHEFISNKLDGFADYRNDPSKDYLSNLSPYLHFGQISPLFVALHVLSTSSPGQESFLEELIVRRELSMNFVHYNKQYDSINCLPSWAKTTLDDHADDSREYIYSYEELEKADTHDPYWNAAQQQMVHTGKMHGYMRMYWGKKILEWIEKPADAFDIALRLNNKYELDGRDPNGYTGIAWCFGKHDRAWKERPIFGKVRYMNDRGLKRKFDIEAYVQKVDQVLEK